MLLLNKYLTEKVGAHRMKFPFNEKENTAVITCRHITENGDSILYATHDADDGIWQFLCGKTHIQEDARVVAINEIFMLDNTVSELSDMPCGYIAERQSKDSKWIVKKR